MILLMPGPFESRNDMLPSRKVVRFAVVFGCHPPEENALWGNHEARIFVGEESVRQIDPKEAPGCQYRDIRRVSMRPSLLPLRLLGLSMSVELSH